MQVDGHGANLRQQDIETLDRVVFELRKHKGFELTVFLEAPKPISTLGKSEPGVMQSPNRGLFAALENELGPDAGIPSLPWASCFADDGRTETA